MMTVEQLEKMLEDLIQKKFTTKCEMQKEITFVSLTIDDLKNRLQHAYKCGLDDASDTAYDKGFKDGYQMGQNDSIDDMSETIFKEDHKYFTVRA